MEYEFRNRGTCSIGVKFELNGNIVRKVKFIGGCSGNTQGISKLIEGMKIDDVIAKCKGIQCRAGTSCPDQLATALEEMKAANKGA